MAEITLPDNSQNQLNFAISRLMNVNNAGEGTNMPPVQQGDQRVPMVTSFTILQAAATPSGTQFTLVWNNVDANSANLNVDHYALYYTLQGTNTSQQVGPFIAHQSPAQIVVPANVITGVTFYIQTVLTNGMANSIDMCPTTAGQTFLPLVTNLNMNIPAILLGPNGSLLLSGFTWSNNSPGAGSIQWSAGQVTYLGQTYPIPGGSTGNTNFYVYWKLASPYAFQVSSGIPVLGQDDFLVSFNGDSGTPAATGFVQNLLEIHNNQGARAFLSPGQLVIYNAEGNPAATIGRTAGDSVGTPGAGIMRIFNGTGAGGNLGGGVVIDAEGTTGHIQGSNLYLYAAGGANDSLLWANDIRNFSSPGTQMGWIPVTIHNQVYYIPVWQ